MIQHHMELTVLGVPRDAEMLLERVNKDHGNVMKEYAALGNPQYPTRAQIERMNNSTALQPAAHIKLAGGKMNLKLEPNSLVPLRTVRAV